MNSDLQWIQIWIFEFFFRSILNKLLHSTRQKVADCSWVWGEMESRSELGGNENDSVHPHVSDVLEIVSSETKGQTVADAEKNPKSC